MLSPKEIAQYYGTVAKAKTGNKWYKTFVLAILAGMFIALGGAAANTLSHLTYAVFLKGLVFPVGLALVLIAGAELFTGNCLLLAGVLDKQITAKAMLKNLSIVFLGNVVGGILVALMIWATGAYSGNMGSALIGWATVKSEQSFFASLVSGILCNILVAIAVWMSYASKSASGKIIVMYLPIMAFVILGFDHVVAIAFYLFGAIFSSVDAGGFTYAVAPLFYNVMLPALIGNAIGGMVFVALPYWFVYLRDDKKEEETIED